MKKKQILCLFAMIATGFMASISQTVIAASTWELPGIGSMKLPANVEFTEGIYDSIPFIDNEQYSEWYFGKNTVKNGHYYVMTYSKPPHYSYGWALSEEVGYPYLLKAGVTTTGKETQEEQLDMIADYIKFLLNMELRILPLSLLEKYRTKRILDGKDVLSLQNGKKELFTKRLIK